ncbi:MAG: efflux RND transporter periplasmic adaptor subunit [Pseudomonadota bacterium]|nr:efflux RND transporter periplasmic adaptor subunit [Pseudomonadota bacterium]
MSRNQTIAVMAASALALLLAGIAAGIWWNGRGTASGGDSAVAAGAGAGPESEVLYWYDPMVPDQRFDKPGKSPFMDMDLVPRYADAGGSAGVSIDPGIQQNLGIRTAPVEVGRLSGQVTVPATLEWDLRRQSVVSVPVAAIVSRLHVRAPYEDVDRGQPLASVLAPEWSSALGELRALEQSDSAAAKELRSAARQRLQVLGLKGGMTAGADGAVVLRAPDAGIVTELLVREGETVMPGAPLFRINGTGTLWLEAAIPQAGTAGIGPGTPVEATVSAVPGRTFEGEVEALLPQVEAGSRTQRARIVLRNEDGLLAPGMFAQLRLQPESGQALPLVPSEALIQDGESSRVLVVGEDGRFVPMAVRTGRSIGGRTEILAGLQGGETVVVSGQFLIDSEASLSGALERLQPVAPARGDRAADDLPEMEMDGMDPGAMNRGGMDQGGMDHGAMDHGQADADAAPGTGERR